LLTIFYSSMSTHIRIFVRLENSERFQILCFNKACSFDQLVQAIATTLQVPALGTLLLVAGAEEAAEVGSVGHIRDGDKCIFVPPSKNNTPSDIAAPNRAPQHRDQEAAVDLTPKDSDISDEEEKETPKKGTRFFYKHGGVLYPVLLYHQNGKSRNPGKGKCYIRHNGMRGMAWEGYGRPICVKVSELVAYTKEREIKYQKRMQMITEKSKQSPENGRKKIESKQPPSAAKQQKRKRSSDKEEDESSSDKKEKDGVRVNVEDIKVGSRFFVLENDVPYPAVVNKLPGRIHSKTVIRDETFHMKWIGFRSGKIVNYSDLLPYTEVRLREYQELEKQAASARKAERAEKEKQARKDKKRKVEQEREARKRKKMEKERRKEEASDRLYGPPTDTSGLRELWRENQVEGRVVDDRVKDRYVYFAHDGDTTESIAKWFKIDIEKVVYDNIKFTEALTKTKQLESFTPIVIPRKWRESTIKNPTDLFVVVKQEPGV
jgi:hypothetical protein